MEIKKLDSFIKFQIQQSTNLTEYKEIKIFHNVLCDVITYINDIYDIYDVFVSRIKKEIPYILINEKKLKDLIYCYLFE